METRKKVNQKMNLQQEQIIEELQKEAERLGHSPKQREILELAEKCRKYFKSFNEAKKKAELKIVNVRFINFPDNAFKLDKDLVTIVAYITADGHLYKDLKGFYFSSKNKDFLKKLNEIVKRKFGLKGEDRNGSGYGESYKLLFFNKKISHFLNEVGVPSGDKMLTSFDVPNWIIKNKDFAKEYLKILFYCEGNKSKHSKNTEAIKINFNKSEHLLEDGIKFMNSLKDLLKLFNIESTEIWVGKGNKRKDDYVTNSICFKIKSKDTNNFIKEIGWLK